MKISGIYIISCANGKAYIGQSVNVNDRLRCHRRDLRKGNHHNLKMQSAWNKYGESAFVFKVALACPVEMLDSAEQQLGEAFFDQDLAFNVSRYFKSPNRGLLRTQETKEKLSLAKTSRPKYRRGNTRPITGTCVISGRKFAYSSTTEAIKAGHTKVDRYIGKIYHALKWSLE